jgi:dTDP-4-amino-4,6-dideoxy-D-galactose acyltransferase
MSIINTGFELRELEWDTNYFGIKCARVRLREALNKENFNKLKNTLSQYEFVTIDNSSEFIKNNELLGMMEQTHLVDVPLTFSFNLSNIEIKNNAEGYEIVNNVDYNNKIEFIAKKSFLPGRFYNDSRIEKNSADGLYSRWIRNSFNREDKYFVLDDKNSGFILFSEIDGGIGLDIELIAVDDKERNKGIAGKMINHIKDYAKENNYKYIDVVTQSHNIAAVNLYSKHDFKLKKCEFTFHYWNK